MPLCELCTAEKQHRTEQTHDKHKTYKMTSDIENDARQIKPTSQCLFFLRLHIARLRLADQLRGEVIQGGDASEVVNARLDRVDVDERLDAVGQQEELVARMEGPGGLVVAAGHVQLVHVHLGCDERAAVDARAKQGEEENDGEELACGVQHRL